MAISVITNGQVNGALSWGTKLGNTFYDLQTNSSVGNRIVRNADGTLSTVWMSHWDDLNSDNTPKNLRGFGYNHFDPVQGWVYGSLGECWEVDNGCASNYIGFPAIVNIPGATNEELVFSHFNGQSTEGFSLTKRANIGTGNWDPTSLLLIDTVYNEVSGINDYGGTWPRAVSSGNYIHALACFSGATAADTLRDTLGVLNPIRYYRSSDAGQTWDIVNYELPFDETDIERVGGDGYAIHANGNTVAITLGAGIDNDWLMLKSDDNGATWSKTLIRDNHNLPTAFTGSGGSKGIITNDDAFSILVDDAGKVHCFAAMAMTDDTNRIYRDPELYFQSGAGILYWKEGMTDPDTIALPDYAYDGDSTSYGTTFPGRDYIYGNYFQSYPTASFDAAGNLYLIYSAIAENTSFVNDNDTSGYNDLYMVFSLNNGDDWCGKYNPISIAEEVYDQQGGTPTQDDVFPSAVPEIGSDNIMHFTWQGDWDRPGLALRDDLHPNDQINYIHYAGLDMSNLQNCASIPKPFKDPTGISGKVRRDIKLNVVPNPANEIANLSSDVEMNTVSVIDVYGKLVKQKTLNSVNTYALDVTGLTPGMYILKIETEKGLATHKLNVIK